MHRIARTHCRVSRASLLFAGLAAFNFSFAADPIPQSRRTDWTYTGVPGGIPNRTNVCATLGPSTTAAAINSALASCSSAGGGVVQLTAGTYNITGIKVADDNVTLRGAGADQTIMKGCNIVNLGNGTNTALGTSIVGGGAKDSRTITVASTAGLAVNKMIEIDRDNDATFVVSTIGGSRHLRQVNLVTAISGSTVTLKNPLLWDFTAGNPKIKFTFSNTRMSGVENLKLDHSGSSGCENLNFYYCYACWLKGIESYKPSAYHLRLLGTLNAEIRDSYIHDAQTYGPNNAGYAVYGNPLYGGNSNGKFENNIFDKVFPGIEMQHSASGFYIGYNYGYSTMSQLTGAPVTYMFLDNHAPHDMMNLWEGNVGELFGSDGYYGSASHATVARNHFTGYNPRFGTRDDPVRLNRLSYHYNLVGNVLGSTNATLKTYEVPLSGCLAGPAVYRIGFPNIGNCGLNDVTGFAVPGMSYPDAKVTSTLLRWGNYDYFNRAAKYAAAEIPAGVAVPADNVIPASYYYSSRPGWFPASVAWPPIGPDVSGGTGDTSGHVHKIPAQVCWETRSLSSGGSFNAASCYTVVGGGGAGGTSSSLSPPANLRVVP
jgi:hypothetical protein